MKTLMIQYLLILLMAVTGCSGNTPHGALVLDRTEINLTDLRGSTITGTELEGKETILNIWATWCKPCIDEMPSLEKLQERLQENQILLLASNEDRKRIQQFLNRYDFDLSFVHLTNDPESLDIQIFPTTLFFDSEGSLINKIEGTRDWSKEALPF